MYTLGLSFFAGMLTILAPCVLPVLPVIVGGSVVNGKKSRPWIIIVSFAVSILLFTLLLTWLVENLGFSQSGLTKISAGILIIFGILLLFPRLRQWITHITGIEKNTQNVQYSAGKKNGVWGDIILGAILGPVFNACSPTYAVLVATVLPASFLRGLTNIIAYIVGFSLIMGAIAYGGRNIIEKMKWASSPDGWFKKMIAGLLILVGVSLLTGWDKKVESFVMEQGLFYDTTNWEIEQTKELRKG